MLTPRRRSERRHDRRGSKDVWLTFFSEDELGILARRFGTLQSLDERRLPAKAPSQRQRYSEGDVITYVREGTIAYVNSLGHSGVVHAGEFQRVTAANQVEHRETNASHVDVAQVFQVALRGSVGATEPSHEQKRFSVAERRDGLCVIASPDARRGSLRLYQDALVYSAVLHAGQHIVHELARERSAWIHVVQGAVSVLGVTLSTGDGAGVYAEHAVSFTARTASEILLLDLGLWTNGR
jgi:redox-sensitive bicupin YhaK (pirin superfamily)